LQTRGRISLKPEQTDQQTLTNFIEKRITSNNGNTIFNGTWKKGNYIIVLEKKEMYINIS